MLQIEFNQIFIYYSHMKKFKKHKTISGESIGVYNRSKKWISFSYIK